MNPGTLGGPALLSLSPHTMSTALSRGQAYLPGPNLVADGLTCTLDLSVPDPPSWGSLSLGILSGQGGIPALPFHLSKENGPPQAPATGYRQDTEAGGAVDLQEQAGSMGRHGLRMPPERDVLS